jgi:hypothetical protein
MTCSNLVVTWKVRPQRALFLDFSSDCVGSPKVVVFWFLSCNWIFNFVPKEEVCTMHFKISQDASTRAF